MDISVIICTYNRSASLKRTLEHIQDMIIPNNVNWELLIVDNNSIDDTHLVVDIFRKTTNINCKYIFEKNQGLSFARNSGITQSEGEIIAFTDDDVIVDKSWIKNIYDAFQRNPNIACIGGKILPVWESPCPEWLKGKLLDRLALCDLGDEKKILSDPKVWGANLSFKSSVIRKYGLFDTDMGHKGGKLYGGEETKYLESLIGAGEKIIYSPHVFVYHCIPESRLRKKYFRKWYFDKGEIFGIQLGEYDNRNIAGVPLIYLRKSLGWSLRYIRNLAFYFDNVFMSQLELCYYLGVISGRLKYRFINNK